MNSELLNIGNLVHKWSYHPYSLENDSKVNKSLIYAKK